VANKYTARMLANEYIVVLKTGVNVRVQTTSMAMDMNPLVNRIKQERRGLEVPSNLVGVSSIISLSINLSDL